MQAKSFRHGRMIDRLQSVVISFPQGVRLRSRPWHSDKDYTSPGPQKAPFRIKIFHVCLDIRSWSFIHPAHNEIENFFLLTRACTSGR